MKRILLALACIGGSLLLHAQPGKPMKKPVTASLNHIAIYVTDLARSTEFYRSIVELDTIPEPFHDGKHTWFRIGPKAALHVISGADSVTGHNKNAHLCFSVGSVDEYVARLRKAGLGYEDWPGKANSVTVRADGVKQIWFRDPDGYWIEVNDAKD